MSECAAYGEIGPGGGHQGYDVKMAMQQCDAYGPVGQGTYELVHTSNPHLRMKQ